MQTVSLDCQRLQKLLRQPERIPTVTSRRLSAAPRTEVETIPVVRLAEALGYRVLSEPTAGPRAA